MEQNTTNNVVTQPIVRNAVNAAVASFYVFGRKYGAEVGQALLACIDSSEGEYDLNDLLKDIEQMIPTVHSIKHVRDCHLAKSEVIKAETGVEIPTDNLPIIGSSGADVHGRLVGGQLQGRALAKTIVGKKAKK